MCESVEFDAFQVKLLVPAGADAAAVAAARAALEDPRFLEAVRRAVHAVLAAVPALAVLSATAEW